MNRTARALQWLFLLCALLLGTFYLVAAAHLFPAMLSDGASHLVPVLNFRQGHGFGSVVWALTRNYDPTGQHRFLQYPPLFHLVLAAMARQATPAGLYLCLAVLAVVSLGLYAVLIFQPRVGGEARLRPLWMALACLSLFAASTWLYYLPSSGRPEALATPLLLLGTLCVLPAPRSWRPVIAGVFIGLLGATQIAMACLAGILFSTYVSFLPAADSRPVRRWAVQVTVASVISLAVFAFCFVFSPYSLADTLRGIVYHLSLLQKETAHYSVFTYFFFPCLSNTFYGLLLIVLPLHFLWWHRRELTWLSVLNVCVFVVVAWIVAVQHPNRSYNLMGLSPVLIALALQLVAALDANDRPPLDQRRRGAIYALYFAIFALMSIGLVRQAVLFDVFEKYGVSYQVARDHLRELLPANADHPVLFDGGLWPLLDRFDRAYQNNAVDLNVLERTPGPEKPVLIIHQWYGRLAAPPAIAGYQLVWDDFVPQPPPSVLGLKVGTAMPGYAFAFYRPLAPDQPPSK